MKKNILTILIFSIIIQVIAGCGNDKDKDELNVSKFDFNTKSITLYHRNVNSDRKQILEKVVCIDDSSVVDKICDEVKEFSFSSQNAANMSMDYYLVFDDTKVVIAFSNFKDDYGSVGIQFRTEYEGKEYKNNSSLYQKKIDFAHIPLKAISIVEQYIKR